MDLEWYESVAWADGQFQSAKNLGSLRGFFVGLREDRHFTQ